MINDLDVLVLSPTPTYPLDYGNRKRIHSVCSALRERGASIHFLYYPREREWRAGTPQLRWREMHQSGRVSIICAMRASPKLGVQ